MEEGGEGGREKKSDGRGTKFTMTKARQMEINWGAGGGGEARR